MISDSVSESIKCALAQLHDERERIEAAICKLEGCLGNLSTAQFNLPREVQRHDNKRSEASELIARKRSTAGWTAEKRQAAAERMRRYWAGQRQQPATEKTTKRRNPKPTRTVKKRSTAGWTEEKRQAASNRMRNYWNQRNGHNAVPSSALSN